MGDSITTVYIDHEPAVRFYNRCGGEPDVLGYELARAMVSTDDPLEFFAVVYGRTRRGDMELVRLEDYETPNHVYKVNFSEDGLTERGMIVQVHLRSQHWLETIFDGTPEGFLERLEEEDSEGMPEPPKNFQKL